MYTNIVVGTDGSATAELAINHAIELAAVSEATIHLVSAYQRERTVKVGTQAESWVVGSSAKVYAVLENAAAAARVKGVKVEVHAIEGDPGDAIVGVAAEVGADAVVVGNKGMRGAKRFLLGSVPNKVAHHAPCTIVIVKTT